MFSSAVSAAKSHSVVNYRTKGITEMVETVQVPWESMYQLQVCRVLLSRCDKLRGKQLEAKRTELVCKW